MGFSGNSSYNKGNEMITQDDIDYFMEFNVVEKSPVEQEHDGMANDGSSNPIEGFNLIIMETKND